MTSYSALTDLTDGGPQLLPGDYIASPDGVYFATPLSNGQFVVAQGSNPALNGAYQSNTVSNTQYLAPSGDNLVSAQVAGGQFTVSATSQGSPNSPTTLFSAGTFNPSQPGFATVSDAGTFALTLGTPSNPSTTLFTNGVNDPVKSLTVSNITYDVNAATLTTSAIGGDSASTTCDNTTGSTGITCHPMLSLSYTKSQTWNWSLTQALTLGLNSTTTVGVPDVASEQAQVQVSETTTLSGGQSSTSSTTEMYGETVDIPTPAYSDYQGAIVAQQATYSVPYTFTGTATYQSGNPETVEGSGVFDGSDATEFGVTVSCISYMNGPCPTGPTLTPGSPVPEPASLLLMPVAVLAVTLTRLPAIALLAAAAIRRVRPARRRAWRRSAPGTILCQGTSGGTVPVAAV